MAGETDSISRARLYLSQRYVLLQVVSSAYSPSSTIGVDFSAAEALLRIQRLCEAKNVLLILCGCSPNSAVGKALRGVNLWAGHASLQVEVFEKLNDALEVSFCNQVLLAVS